MWRICATSAFAGGETAEVVSPVETSGVAFVGDLACELMSVGPKLSNSTLPERTVGAERGGKRFELSGRAAAADRHVRLPAQVPVVELAAGPGRGSREVPGATRKRGSVQGVPDAAGAARVELVERSQMLAEYCLQTGFALVAAVAGNALGDRGK